MEWFIERTVLFAESLLCRAFVIGWCAEILQAGFLIADDIMDNAEKRRYSNINRNTEEIIHQSIESFLFLL